MGKVGKPLSVRIDIGENTHKYGTKESQFYNSISSAFYLVLEIIELSDIIMIILLEEKTYRNIIYNKSQLTSYSFEYERL